MNKTPFSPSLDYLLQLWFKATQAFYTKLRRELKTNPKDEHIREILDIASEINTHARKIHRFIERETPPESTAALPLFDTKGQSDDKNDTPQPRQTSELP